MEYNFPVTLDRQFKNKLEELHDKYGDGIMEIEGLSPKQLDTCDFFKNFMANQTVADASIDDNANVTGRNICTMLDESRKPFTKLLSRNKIYIEMKEDFGKEVADKFLEDVVSGRIYEHDSHNSSLMPYCFAFSIQPIVEKGLFFLNEMKGGRPKHWDTFNHHILEFIAYATQMQAGAVGIPDYLIYAYYFFRNDTKDMTVEQRNKYKNQKFQEFIFNLNQPYLKNGVQSAYTNISILDLDHIAKFFGEKIYPDGSQIMDYVDELLDFQRDFLDYAGQLRKEKWYTFPVMSASLIFKDGKYADEDTAKMVVEHNHKYGFNDVNIMNVEEVTSLASCCFDGEQKTLTKSSVGGIQLMSFEEIYNANYSSNKKNFKIFHNGNWVAGKTIRIPKMGKDMYKITTVNNKELLMTSDHINVTMGGNKEAQSLSDTDYIAFNNRIAFPVPEKDMKLTYEQGVLIGAYLGDGSKSKNENHNSIYLSLNEEKYINLLPKLNKAFKQIGAESDLYLGKIKNNVYPCTITDKEVRDFVEFWVKGSYCNEKSINLDCLIQSIDFRKGIIDGIYATDGGNSNRIYSTSKEMIDGLEAIMTSLGMFSIIDISDRTDEKVIIRGEEFNRNFVLYCIRFYNPKHKRNKKGIYKTVNNTTYFKIKNIEKYNHENEYVYCFEMKDEDEPYFTLPNGVMTHNCRLVSDKSKIEETKKIFNSIGGSDLNVGSSKVVTINFPRLSMESHGNYELFLKLIKEEVEIIHKYHFSHRKILQKLIDKGMLPLYTHGMMHLVDQFATVGINGIFEAVKVFKGISEDSSGVYYNEHGFEIVGDIFKVIDTENEKTMDRYCYLSNKEIAPYESGAVKSNKKDRLIFGNNFVDGIFGKGCNIYGNQWIPLKQKASIYNRIEASKLDALCDGGSILHLNFGEPFASFEDAWEFTVNLAKKGIRYFSYISLIDICGNDHSFFGNTCPICSEKSASKGIKIVGYMVKQDSYKKERKQELAERQFYNQSQI